MFVMWCIELSLVLLNTIIHIRKQICNYRNGEQKRKVLGTAPFEHSPVLLLAALSIIIFKFIYFLVKSLLIYCAAQCDDRLLCLV